MDHSRRSARPDSAVAAAPKTPLRTSRVQSNKPTEITTMAEEALDRTRSPRSRTRLLEKPPGKSGEDLVHSFARMDEGIRKLLEAGSYGGAERSIADWKADVAQLATLVRSQIDRCRILRTSDTLEAVLQDDPHVKSVAELRSRVNQYIADIRALFEALEKRVLLPDHRNRIAQQQREALEPSANAARVPAETAWDKQVKDLETKLDALKMLESDTKYPTTNLLEVIELRDALQLQLNAYAIKIKQDLDSSMGVVQAFAEKVDDRGPMSKSSLPVRQSVKVVDCFLELEKLVRHARLVREDVSHADAMQRLRDQNKEMLDELEAAEGKIEQLTDAVNIFKVGSEARAVAQQSLRLDQALSRIRHLESEIRSLRVERSDLLKERGQVVVEREQVQKQLNELTERFRHKMESQVQVRSLEEEVGNTAVAFDKLKLNIDLITNIYKKSAEELTAAKDVQRASAEQQAVLTHKINQMMRERRVLRQELHRKDLINARLVAALEVTKQSLREAKGEM